MFVHITSSSVWVAERPPFGKELLTRLTICSVCISTICCFSYFPFVRVPGLCKLVTFYSYTPWSLLIFYLGSSGKTHKSIKREVIVGTVCSIYCIQREIHLA